MKSTAIFLIFCSTIFAAFLNERRQTESFTEIKDKTEIFTSTTEAEIKTFNEVNAQINAQIDSLNTVK